MNAYRKIRIPVADHPLTDSETVWALPIEGEQKNLFQLHNTPWLAYGYHYLDIVEATQDDTDELPVVQAVAVKSGHRTIRVFFESQVGSDRQAEILKQLTSADVTVERANAALLALDIKPEGDFDKVVEKLSELVEKRLLQFELA